MVDIDKIVIITKKTWLEELIERFNTKAQANFYIDHNIGPGNFEYYEAAHEQYHESLNRLKKLVYNNYRSQIVDREFLPNFLFNRTDLIVPIGPDGLVINAAKYLDGQNILAINPDPERIDGILIPFGVDDFNDELIERIKVNDVNIARITMAKVQLNNGQVLYGVNDIFIGPRTHQSARYAITFNGETENHSSSGIIISTGAGSTGWLRSVVTGAMGITHYIKGGERFPTEYNYRFDWSSNYLKFSVREPFTSKMSQANIVFGQINEGSNLKIQSRMPENGVIFSDGIEKDFLKFNSGTIAKVGIAERKVKLIKNE